MRASIYYLHSVNYRSIFLFSGLFILPNNGISNKLIWPFAEQAIMFTDPCFTSLGPKAISGEYVYVSGSADQDGFYFGETTDGRRGLVPGNYLELVPNLAAPPYRTASAEVSNGKLTVSESHRVGGAESPVSKCFELFELDGKVRFASNFG